MHLSVGEKLVLEFIKEQCINIFCETTNFPPKLTGLKIHEFLQHMVQRQNIADFCYYAEENEIDILIKISSSNTIKLTLNIPTKKWTGETKNICDII